MMPLPVIDHQAPVPPPAYQRGQARLGPALPIDALTLVTTPHLLTLCHLAVRLAHRRCPPPLSAGPGREALREPLVGKDGDPRIPSPSQQCKRRRAEGAPLHESLFVLTVLHAIRRCSFCIPMVGMGRPSLPHPPPRHPS
jgi:hypothetical protein